MPTVSPTTSHPPDAFQQAVITSTELSIRVLAPAGSGKTETLARRAGHQIKHGIAPHRILILTFDNQARTSFQGALKRLGVSGNVEIRTLNAFGLRLLFSLFPDERNRTAQTFHGSKEPLLKQLVDDQTDGTILTELFGTLKSHLFDPQNLKTTEMKRWVIRNYSRLVPERFLATHPESSNAKEFATQLAREFKRYEKELQKRRSIDFEDQKLRAYTLLQQQPEIASRVRSRYDEVIVDEVQDINPLDQKLIELISRDANLIITGDDDQAIYGFRWASANYLIRPDKAFGRAFVSYELQTNYRCPKTVLDRSSQLIRRNRNRVPKHPKSGVDQPGAIIQVPAEDRLAGSRAIVTMLQERVAANTTPSWGDIAILARRNQYLDEIQVQLISAGIPHHVKSERDLIQTWASALALLDLSTELRSPKTRDAANLQPAIAAYIWFPRIVRRDGIQQFADLTARECADRLATIVPAHSLKRFQDSLALLKKQKSVTDELTIVESRFLGIEPLKRGDQAPQDRPLELLRAILSRGDSSRKKTIDRLRGFIDRAQQVNQSSGSRVELATYHGAKGRQWHTVVLPWTSTATTPDPLMRADLGELEAERRLFYVAMTRAADTLIVGHPSETAKETPSGFLEDAGLIAPTPKSKPPKAKDKPSRTLAKQQKRATATTVAERAMPKTRRNSKPSTGG